MTERLDRIEAILEQVAQEQHHLISRFDSLVFETQRIISSFGDRQVRTEATLEFLTDAVARLTQSESRQWEAIRETQADIRQLATTVNTLGQKQQTTEISISNLAALVVRLVENAEQDRAVMREVQAEVRGLQTEVRQILEFLFNQQQNGNGGDRSV